MPVRVGNNSPALPAAADPRTTGPGAGLMSNHPDDLPPEFFTDHFAQCPALVGVPGTPGVCTCDETERDLRAEFWEMSRKWD